MKSVFRAYASVRVSRAYTDPDYARDIDSRLCQQIECFGQHQNCAVLSITEAEYVAVFENIKQSIIHAYNIVHRWNIIILEKNGRIKFGYVQTWG